MIADVRLTRLIQHINFNDLMCLMCLIRLVQCRFCGCCRVGKFVRKRLDRRVTLKGSYGARALQW